MKFLNFFLILVFFSCSKKESSPAPSSNTPAGPVKKSSMSFFIQQYDSYGDLMTDASNIQVKLSGTSFIDTTNIIGFSSMDSIPQGTYNLMLTKTGFDSPNYSIDFKADSRLSFNGIISETSKYSVSNFEAKVVNLDSITVSFKLVGNPIPAGKKVNVEILIGETNNFGTSNFKSHYKISTSSLDVKNFNIANDLFVNYYLSSLAGNTFYLQAFPASTGVLMFNKSTDQLVGESLSPSSSIMLTKNWK